MPNPKDAPPLPKEIEDSLRNFLNLIAGDCSPPLRLDVTFDTNDKTLAHYTISQTHNNKDTK